MRVVCIIPAGPAPIIATVSPGSILHFLNALTQHATGSIRVASSNEISFGILNVSIFRFGAGTLKYSANPPGICVFS